MTEFLHFHCKHGTTKVNYIWCLAFSKENNYIRVNFIMYSLKVKIKMGPDFGPKGYIKGNKYALICL